MINKGNKFFSIEVSPPPKNKSIFPIFKTIELFMPYNPAYVSITYHPLKITHIEVDGMESDYIQKKHVNPLGLCAAVKYKYNLEVVPHFVCAGMNKVQVEEALIDFSFLGIENVLALRGDPAIANEQFKPIDGGYNYAYELVKQIYEMRKPLFMNKVDDYQSINLCIGVAGYPEKHIDAKSIESDIDNLKKKIDAGADYIITQMCFNVNVFIEWVNILRKKGINVPIIPGIKPLTSINQLIILRDKYKIIIQNDLNKLIMSANSKEDSYKKGIEHCVKMCNDLLDTVSNGIHFFTMGLGKDIEDVIKIIYK